MLLRQSSILFGTKKEFRIQNSGLDVTEYINGRTDSYTIPFEEIGDEMAISKHMGRGLLIIPLLLFLMGALLYFIMTQRKTEVFEFFIMSMIVGSIGLISLIFILLYKVKLIFIGAEGARIIQFALDKPPEASVMAFINLLLDSRRCYFKNKYTKIDRDLPVDYQLYNFYKLTMDNIISYEEYLNLKRELLEEKSKTIGFRLN